MLPPYSVPKGQLLLIQWVGNNGLTAVSADGWGEDGVKGWWAGVREVKERRADLGGEDDTRLCCNTSLTAFLRACVMWLWHEACDVMLCNSRCVACDVWCDVLCDCSMWRVLWRVMWLWHVACDVTCYKTVACDVWCDVLCDCSMWRMMWRKVRLFYVNVKICCMWKTFPSFS